MHETDLLQKVRKLHTDGALTADDLQQIEAAFQAKKQLPWFRITAVLLPLVLLISAFQRMSAGGADGLPVGFTRSSGSHGATLDYRWVSGPPTAPVRFFTHDGQWEYRPHKTDQAIGPSRAGQRASQATSESVDGKSETSSNDG